MKRPTFSDRELNALQRDTFKYFWQETNAANGLLADNTSGTAPASIAESVKRARGIDEIHRIIPCVDVSVPTVEFERVVDRIALRPPCG